MVLKMTLVFWLYFSISVMASTDSLRVMSQDRAIEITGHPQEQKPAKPSAVVKIKNIGNDSCEWSNDSRFVSCRDRATVVSKMVPFHTQTEKLANHL